MVVGSEGQILGEMITRDALALAREQGLDLVEINSTSRPPVCRIMDYGRFKYDQSKKEKESRAKQKESGLKEIRLTAKIGDHDIEYKAKQAKEFFDRGNKVKVSMRLRGRENVFADQAFEVFKKFSEQSGLEYESSPSRAGNLISGILTKRKNQSSVN
jgi:translation initiation factor IF-3